MRTIIFDDAQGTLAPLTDLRPSFALRTGARTTLERTSASLAPAHEFGALCVPAGLLEVTRRAHPGTEVLTPDTIEDHVGAEQVLLVNGRCVVCPPAVSTLTGSDSIVSRLGEDDPTPDLVAAVADGAGAARLTRGEVPASATISIDVPCCLRRPWDIRRFRDEALALDVAALADAMGKGDRPSHVHARGDHVLSIHETADIWPGVVFDVSAGPVVVDDHATVRPNAVITGPAYIGAHSTINDNAVIKANTAIGPHCKIGGEVGGTIFQGFANKGHDGHLGDSFVGEWANLGAGTTNSNLLNTYADVPAIAAPGGRHERTGIQFLGAVIGDHVKTAISTRLMTGAIVHTGTMWAATPAITGCIAPMRWVTDAGERPYRFDKFMDVARTVMDRRGIQPSEAYEALLRAIGS